MKTQVRIVYGLRLIDDPVSFVLKNQTVMASCPTSQLS